PAVFAGLQRQLAQTMLPGPLDTERLIAGQGLVALLQAQAEALLQQVARRVLEAVDQLARLQGQTFAVGSGRRQAGGERRRRGGGLAEALRGVEPGGGEALVAVAGEVAGREGLQRMLDADAGAGRRVFAS